ncbi:MAG: LysR family transcriptional regulator [Hyphomicrobiaceae bacterium]
MIEIRHLKYFLRVAELGSISRAALELRLGQSALSRQIRALEESLGVALFVRDGRGVSLTDVGARFSLQVKELLQGLENACVAARAQQKTPSGEIRLGILPNFGGAFAAELIIQCEQQFPGIKLIMFEGFSYQIAAWIQNRQIDLGFLYEAETYRHVSSEFRFREAAYLVGMPKGWEFGATVPFAALEHLALITPALPSLTRRRLATVAADRSIDLSFTYEVDSLVAIKRLIALGRGYGVFTRAAIWEEVERGELAAARIVEPEIDFDLALVSPYGAVLPAPARHTIGFLRAVVAKGAKEERWSGHFVPAKTLETPGG